MTKEAYRIKYKIINGKLNRIGGIFLIMSIILMIVFIKTEVALQVIIISFGITYIFTGIMEALSGYLAYKGEYCKYSVRTFGNFEAFGKKAQRKGVFAFLSGIIVTIIGVFLFYLLIFHIR